ncbi:MAG: HAEPLYID family protein [Ferruginibacter sp.]
MKNKFLLLFFCFGFVQQSFSQNTKKEEGIKHYMPLYLDIPAEMNVKKGYKEINIAGGYADFKDFNGERALVEYDFAPIDKLGFEIEIPFVFVHQKIQNMQSGNTDVIIPEEGGAVKSAMALRVGFSYSLCSFQKAKTSIAVGYFNEFELTPFEHFGKPLLEGNVYNPFIAVAKIFGDRFHTMIYTGPAIKQSFELHESKTNVRFNTIISYRFGKGNKETFAGVECNQTWAKAEAGQMVLRPQIQVEITEKWKLGFVGGIPIATSNNLNASGFMRLIYSPR